MNTTDTTKLRFRSVCCGAEMKPLPEGHHLSKWHELKDNGESCLMAYGVCEKCGRTSEFRQTKKHQLNMKKSIIAGLIVLVLIGATSAWPRKAGADQALADKIRAVSEASQARDSALMWTITIEGEENYTGPGFLVGRVSSSDGAPAVQVGADLSQTLNYLRQRGGQLTIHNWGFLTYTVTH